MGRAADCYLDLCKFRAEQPTTRKFCVNLARRVGWHDCAILEPSRMSKRIPQFLEGRLVSLQKCTNLTGKLLNL